MTVTRIEAVTKAKYKVYIDGQFVFVLYKGELSRYRLAEGSLIEEEVYHKILTEVILKRSKRRALHLLNDMGRTEEQLKTRLRRDLYPEDVIDETMAYVKSFGYINDAAYAQYFVETRRGKKSRKEIYAQMCRKGLKSEDIEAAFEECYGSGDAREAIEAILRKKKYDPEEARWEDTRKILGYLTRKGFGYEDIRQVIQVSEWNA